MESAKAAAKILIVEDQRIVAKDLQHRVAQLGHRPLGIVTNGKDAIRSANELRPDVVLMDISLEGPLDGIQAAEEIGSRVMTSIVYVTAHSDQATLERANRTHPSGYLIKPVEDEDLKQALERALIERGRPCSTRGSTLNVSE